MASTAKLQKTKKTFSFKEDVLNIRNIDKRDFGLDLVKVIAMIFVPCVHFFLYNGHYYYYTIGQEDTTAFIFTTVIRDLFFICVPLFMLVTGALSYYHPADLSKRHYVKITPILVNSLIIGLLVIWYKLATVAPGADTTALTPYRLAQALWSGNLPSYGWYVNMYVSLFVLMPIIDAAYNSLDSQKKKTGMMIACILLSVIPMSVNKFKIEDTSIGMMPSFFSAVFWPVAYYVVGKYIREFNIKVNRVLLSCLLLLCLIYQSVKVVLTGQGTTFFKAVYADNGDFISMLTAVCFFLMIYNINTKNKVVRSIFASLSSITLSVYLLSWFCDQTFYKGITPTIHTFGDYPLAFLKVVPLTLLLSILAAYVVGVLIKLISRPIMSFILNHSIFKSKKTTAK